MTDPPPKWSVSFLAVRFPFRQPVHHTAPPAGYLRPSPRDVVEDNVLGFVMVLSVPFYFLFLHTPPQY